MEVFALILSTYLCDDPEFPSHLRYHFCHRLVIDHLPWVIIVKQSDWSWRCIRLCNSKVVPFHFHFLNNNLRNFNHKVALVSFQDLISRSWAAWNVEYRRVAGPGWKDTNSTLQELQFSCQIVTKDIQMAVEWRMSSQLWISSTRLSSLCRSGTSNNHVFSFRCGKKRLQLATSRNFTNKNIKACSTCTMMFFVFGSWHSPSANLGPSNGAGGPFSRRSFGAPRWTDEED